MKWIDARDLQTWAGRRACQDTLPLLVRKLIRATTNSIKTINFPSGESVLLGGWDGVLEILEQTENLPIGISLWEFGASVNPKGKAEEDYSKRTNNPLGYIPAETIFVFVTPRLWNKGKEWAHEKKKEGIWKDILVFDAQALEEWIDIAPTVGSWLAKKERIGNYPAEGIQPTDDFWEEWTSGNKIKLNAEILLGGRKEEKERVLRALDTPTIITVQGLSREESLAFFISCIIGNVAIEEDFFSRSIIVDNIDAFRELSAHDKPLILIPRFEDTGVINRAVTNGHIVMYPLGADSTNGGQNKIVLPQIERGAFVLALVKQGLSKENAEKYSRESARNITILRRLLEFERTQPSWAKPESALEIIPALLIGRWDENFERDKDIIARVAGESYDIYIKKLTCWLHTNDAPLVKIGSTWRLTSPFDAWTNASKFLTQGDFNLLRNAVMEVLTEINPAFEIETEKRRIASLYGKTRQYSNWLREGVVQSLIMTSLLGDKLKFNISHSPSLWVDQTIAELLSNNSSEFWKSIEENLPVIAEASPNALLNAIEKLIQIENSPIVSLFDEEPGFITSRTYYTGLLWALENLAWFPEFLSRATLILAKLAAIDPGGSLSNRPINSLTEIFKSWHYQTLATFNQRMEVLALIAKREPEIGWIILIRMLPQPVGGVGHPTHKMRWRMFELETEKPITYREIYDTHSAVVEMLISIFDFKENKIANLIENSVGLFPSDREKLFSFIEASLPQIKFSQNKAWQVTKDILSHHRSHPETEWSLPESELIKYQHIYNKLTPLNEIDLVSWMFNENWPQFPEGYIYESGKHDKQEQIIFDRRITGLKFIYEKYGLDKIIDLITSINEKWIFGDTLSHILVDEEEIITLCSCISSTSTHFGSVQGFIFRKSILYGNEWVFDLIEKLINKGLNNVTISKLLLPLNPSQALWDYLAKHKIEIVEEYWRNICHRFYGLTPVEKAYGIRKLIENKRFNSAVDISASIADELPSVLIIDLLHKAAFEKAQDIMSLDAYDITRLIENLDKRSDIEEKTLIELEWLFLPQLSSFSSNHKPKRLHSALSKDPVFAMEVLKCIYRPDDESKIEEIKNLLTDVQIENRARKAYELIESWERIPGFEESGTINYKYLFDWISKLRELAQEYGRVEVAEIHIGKILAQCPELSDTIWPPEKICEIIEELNSETLNKHFVIATYNKRSYSSRGPYDGGIIEWNHAKYFRQQARAHQMKFPKVANILEQLAKKYQSEAKIMDEQATRDKLEY